MRERNFWTGSPFGRQVKGVDVDAVLADGRALLAERPRTNAQLRAFMAERWPGWDPTSLAYAVHHLVPVVQVPPRGVWGQKGLATWAATEHWLGQPVDPAPSIDQVVLRYLAAFGPASVMDVQAWSGLTRLREVTDGSPPRPGALPQRAGRSCSTPDPPDPRPGTPARPVPPSVRHVALSHAPFPTTGGATPAADRTPTGRHLVDGFVAGAWRLAREGKPPPSPSVCSTSRRPGQAEWPRKANVPAHLPRPRRRAPRDPAGRGGLARCST